MKEPWNEVSHSCPKVNNEWHYTSAPPLFVYGVNRDKYIYIYFFYFVKKSYAFVSLTLFLPNDTLSCTDDHYVLNWQQSDCYVLGLHSGILINQSVIQSTFEVKLEVYLNVHIISHGVRFISFFYKCCNHSQHSPPQRASILISHVCFTHILCIKYGG